VVTILAEISFKTPWFLGETIQLIELESLFLVAWFSHNMATPRFQTAVMNYSSLLLVDCRLSSVCAGGLAGCGAVSPAPTFGSTLRRLGLLGSVCADTASKLPNGNFSRRYGMRQCEMSKRQATDDFSVFGFGWCSLTGGNHEIDKT
jgi:hypothetical protein